MTTNRTWNLYATRRDSGVLWHIGEKWWVELHGSADPVVPVLVEEWTDNPIVAEVTHYGWEDRDRPRDKPSMIYPRAAVSNLKPWALLEMCFPYGLQIEIDHGRGVMLALRVSARV